MVWPGRPSYRVLTHGRAAGILVRHKEKRRDGVRLAAKRTHSDNQAARRHTEHAAHVFRQLDGQCTLNAAINRAAQGHHSRVGRDGDISTINIIRVQKRRFDFGRDPRVRHFVAGLVHGLLRIRGQRWFGTPDHQLIIDRDHTARILREPAREIAAWCTVGAAAQCDMAGLGHDLGGESIGVLAPRQFLFHDRSDGAVVNSLAIAA